MPERLRAALVTPRVRMLAIRRTGLTGSLRGTGRSAGSRGMHACLALVQVLQL